MLKKLKNNYFLFVSSFLILYFFVNLLSGQRGLISYFEKKQVFQSSSETISSATIPRNVHHTKKSLRVFGTKTALGWGKCARGMQKFASDSKGNAGF